MKRKILFFILLFAIAACSKGLNESTKDEGVTVFSESQALESFAKVLSKAVFESEELRVFLKEQSLNTFDNDYDVFYPFVKDKLLKSGLTFRDHLLKYIPENELKAIEKSAPLLTIYVPDTRWLGENEFYAGNWDCSSPHVLTTYRHRGVCKFLFAEGNKIDKLRPGVVPDIPTLIIKSNERMKASPSTKSGEVQYSFIDPAFNGVRTKYQHPFDPEVSYWNYDVESVSNSISADSLLSISPMTAHAYEILKPYANISSQRDYCYYGMTSTTSKGIYNKNVVDRLFRFRILPEAFSKISDDFYHTNNATDPYLQERETADVDDGYYGKEEIISKIWSDGYFEIGLSILYGDNATNSTYVEKFISIRPQDLFQIKKVKKEYWHSTWFKWYQNWLYSVNPKDLASKWYYPSSIIELVDWDLTKGHTEVKFRFFEVDSDAEFEKEEKFSYKFLIKLDLMFDSKEKIKLGLSTQYEASGTKTFKVKWKQKNDPLGEFIVGYNTPYISNKTDNRYSLYELSSGSIVMNILPFKTVNY